MEVSKQLNIPILGDILRTHEVCKCLMSRKPAYGEVSTFSLWVNHVNVKTGISDKDRALTIQELHRVVSLVNKRRIGEAREIFLNEFYFPGHIPILISKGLKHRKGHTELSVSLALMAGLEPSVVFAEMLDKGTSMSLAKVKKYAKEKSLRLVKGEEILEYAVKKGYDV
jgi:3,4-dihydroxy 2-butanone 4-phosphate synthase